MFVTGGFQSGKASYSTAALYSLSTGQFTLETGPCNCRGFNGALLQTGEVLVAGGAITVPGNPYPTSETINSAELWDPSTQTWTSTGNLKDSRSGESVTVLLNGEALVAGGAGKYRSILSSAMLYDPSTNYWTLTGSLHQFRRNHTLTVLPNGRALAAGGVSKNSSGATIVIASAEFYTP